MPVRRRCSLATLLALATLACSAGSSPGTPGQVWTALSSEKLRPDAVPGPDAAAHVHAARNEGEAFQIAIAGAVRGVRASATPLSGPGGAQVAAPRLHREALINLPVASSLDGGTGRWPDALVPDVDEVVGERRNAFPFDVPAGECRVIWAQLQVPAGTPAGDYSGSVRLTWDGGAADVPVTLTVWGFDLPAAASLKTAFGFSYGAIPGGHGLPYGDAFMQLRARYGAFALGRRITLSQVDDGDPSASHFDALYSGQMDGTAETAIAGARLTAVQRTGDTASWGSLFQSRGWFDRLFDYTCDEPPIQCAWTDIPSRAAAAKVAAPGLRTLVTTTIQEADANGVTSSIDILTPVVNYLEDRPGWSQFSGPQRARYDAFLASSPQKELWTYQSCMSHGCGGTVDFSAPTASAKYFVGWPTYVIDAAAVRNRAMEWISFLHGVSGELYYETAQAYTHDPWTNQRDFNGNGDGTLFYPGTPARIGGSTHIPVSSIRLEMVREGMEDYEYLKRVSDLGDPAFARQVASELFTAPWATEVPPAALEAARARLAARILELLGAPTP